MNPRQNSPVTTLAPRQQVLTFARSQEWDRLPEAARKTCQQVLVQMLVQVTTHQQENSDE